MKKSKVLLLVSLLKLPRTMPETTRLVLVPRRVQHPPRTAAKDNGMRKREAGWPAWRASPIRTGVKPTTTGVLLTKAEIAPAPSMTIRMSVT